MSNRPVVRTRPLLPVLAALLLGACGGPGGGTSGGGGDAGGMVYHRGNAAEPDTLDPHLAQGVWEDDIIGDMLMGLTTQGPNGDAIPGAATSWDTSADGLSWTFHIREHEWSDGVPVTAEDFVFSYRRILDPVTASAYAYYLYPILNAEDVNAGRMPTAELGVEAPDERTLIIRLENPAPYLAEFLTHHTTFPVPKHVVERLGDSWSRPGNYVSNGPYILTEWVPNDHVTTVRNPRFYDAANVAIDRVIYYPSSDYVAALQRFRAGELDTQARLPSVQIDWIRQNIPETIDLEPTLTVEYIALNQARPYFQDVRVREALNLALDRETIVNQVIRMGNPPAYGMVPPGIANYEGGVRMDFATMAKEQRLQRAKALMEQAGYGPDNRLRFGLAVRSASADARRVPAAIQQMWREVYADVEIEQSDAAIFYALMQEHDFDAGIAGWVADFNDPSNFLDLLRTGNDNNYGQYSNPEYDALLDEAAREQDLDARAELLARAEQIALDDFVWVPEYFGVSTALVEPYVIGWQTSVNEKSRTRWMRIDEAARAEKFPALYGR